jgi:hypothetical protein
MWEIVFEENNLEWGNVLKLAYAMATALPSPPMSLFLVLFLFLFRYFELMYMCCRALIPMGCSLAAGWRAQ